MTLERLRVAVVRGGATPRYENSLASGETVLRALRASEARYAPIDIFVDRSGVWHLGGLPTDAASALRYVDLVWNASDALHNDERLEQVAERLKIPYIGSSALARALSENISHTREVYARAGLPCARYAILNRDRYSDKDAVRIFQNFLHPVSIRPAGGREAVFASAYADLEAAIAQAFARSAEAVVEELKKGKEAAVSVIEQARGEKLYTLLPSEHRSGETIAPGNFSPEEKRRLSAMARAAHEALGHRQYSVSRFVVTPKSVYILETSALPELHTSSHLAESLAATGWKEKDFVDHLIQAALS